LRLFAVADYGPRFLDNFESYCGYGKERTALGIAAQRNAAQLNAAQLKQGLINFKHIICFCITNDVPENETSKKPVESII
jgi:hypothetical protein